MSLQDEDPEGKFCGYCLRLIQPGEDAIHPIPTVFLHRSCGRAYQKNGYSLTNLKGGKNLKQFLRIYKLYSMIILFTVYIIDLNIWIDSSLKGLSGGTYSVLIRTDVIGENWPELLILLSVLPGIILLLGGPFVRLVQKQRPPIAVVPAKQ